MSVATAAITVTNTFVAGPVLFVVGTVAISASPGTYATGGLTLSFADQKIKSDRTPIAVIFQGINGYSYSYIAGSTAFDGKIKACSTADTEVSASSVPAGVSGDTIGFAAFFTFGV